MWREEKFIIPAHQPPEYGKSLLFFMLIAQVHLLQYVQEAAAHHVTEPYLFREPTAVVQEYLSDLFH